MAGVVDAGTHIIEHPGLWELFDRDMYHRRPVSLLRRPTAFTAVITRVGLSTTR